MNVQYRATVLTACVPVLPQVRTICTAQNGDDSDNGFGGGVKDAAALRVLNRFVNNAQDGTLDLMDEVRRHSRKAWIGSLNMVASTARQLMSVKNLLRSDINFESNISFLEQAAEILSKTKEPNDETELLSQECEELKQAYGDISTMIEHNSKLAEEVARWHEDFEDVVARGTKLMAVLDKKDGETAWMTEQFVHFIDWTMRFKAWMETTLEKKGIPS